MSVTLINIFEDPAGDEEEFITAWEKTRDYLMTQPAHIETALHQSLHDTRFRFVNIAHWTSEAEFNAALGSPGFQEAASGLRTWRRRCSRTRSTPRSWKSRTSAARRHPWAWTS